MYFVAVKKGKIDSLLYGYLRNPAFLKLADPETGRAFLKAMTKSCCKMFNAVVPAVKSNISDRFIRGFQQHFCMVQSYGCKILVWR